MEKRIFRNSIAILIIIMCVSACQKRGILPKDKMAAVMTEINQLDVVATQQHLRYNDKGSPLPGYYQYILDKYNTDRDQYERSLAYYAKNNALMDSIYDIVLGNMNKFRVEVEFGKYSCLTREELGLPKTLVPTQERINKIVPECDTTVGVNLWTEKTIYRVPLEGNSNTIDFLYRTPALKNAKEVQLSFTAKLYADDKSVNPHCQMIVEYPKSNDTVTLTLKQNNKWELYNLKYTSKPNENIKNIRGSLFKCDTITTPRHAIFWNVHLFKLN